MFMWHSPSTVPLKPESKLQNLKNHKRKNKTKQNMAYIKTQIILLLILVVITIVVMVT